MDFGVHAGLDPGKRRKFLASDHFVERVLLAVRQIHEGALRNSKLPEDFEGCAELR
jgi:hypothetical protein